MNPAGADGVLGYTDPLHDGSDDDFHEQSLVGSFHGGSLAPILNATTGLPAFPKAVLTADTAQSPAIDRGAASDAFSSEPAPNGGFINLGTYGNTAQASESLAQYVQVLRPSGGQVWPKGATFTILWRSQDTAGQVKIELLQQGNPTPILTIAASVPNSGSYSWTIPSGLTPAGNYLVRVTRKDAIGASGTSGSPISIVPPVNIYYVNDGTVNPSGDWTTAPGNDANDGLSPATPKASISAILVTYTPGYGDIIRVDAGTYNLSSNIAIPLADSGVTIIGYNDPAHPDRQAVINRGDQNGGSYDFELTGGNDVTLDHLGITGGYAGVEANDTGSQRLTVSNSEIYGNADFGIQLYGYTLTDAHIINNRVHDNGFYAGISVGSGAGFVITGNTAYNNNGTGIQASPGTGIAGYTVTGNTAYGNRDGINAGGTGTLVADNTTYDNSEAGIIVGYQTVAEGNTAYGQLGSGSYGIEVAGGEAQDNVVFDNYNGFVGSGTFTSNRIYDNVASGLSVGGNSSVVGNQVYDNAIGLQGSASGAGVFTNNLIYANTTLGVGIHGTYGILFANNTVYELTGDALAVDSSVSSMQVKSNILWAVTGTDITVAPDSEVGFTSDYNDLVTANGNILGAGRAATSATGSTGFTS